MKVEEINITEEELRDNLKSLLIKEEFVHHQQRVKRLSDDLKISVLDCAAALSLLVQPSLGSTLSAKVDAIVEKPAAKQKIVRYRLDIGKKHQVSVEQVKALLIEVSGVDKNRIVRLDVRNYYSLVDLPEGMPADVFQLLADEELNQRKLNIKRLKYQSRFYRRNSKK